MSKKHLAIFDLDGTLFRSSLSIELVNGLVREGIFPQEALDEVEEDYLAWLNRKGKYEKYVLQIVAIYLKYIKGCRQNEVEKVGKKVLKSERDKVYRFTRDLIKELRKKDYYLLSISGSPTFIVSEFSSYIGFNMYYGSFFEVKNNVFTGKEIYNPVVDGKGKALNHFLESHEGEFDLKNSIAVGDTDSDIPLLSAVGNPIAFNPNFELAKYAKRNKWRIVVERKDVMYEINDFEFTNGKKKY